MDCTTLLRCMLVRRVCREAIERIRLRNEDLQAELVLESREAKLVEGETTREQLSALERENQQLNKKIEDLRKEEIVRHVVTSQCCRDDRV
jgi:hypothetical protein